MQTIWSKKKDEEKNNTLPFVVCWLHPATSVDCDPKSVCREHCAHLVYFKTYILSGTYFFSKFSSTQHYITARNSQCWCVKLKVKNKNYNKHTILNHSKPLDLTFKNLNLTKLQRLRAVQWEITSRDKFNKVKKSFWSTQIFSSKSSNVEILYVTHLNNPPIQNTEQTTKNLSKYNIYINYFMLEFSV